MSNDDELKQLRNYWTDFFKWTVSISIFLITISLTVLTFQKDIDPYNRVSVYITMGFLMPNIILSWFLLKLNVSVLKTKLELQEKWPSMVGPEKQAEREKDYNEFDKKKKRAKPLENWITLTFILGFVSFIFYLVTYIR